MKTFREKGSLGINPRLLIALYNLKPEQVPKHPTSSQLQGLNVKRISKAMKDYPREVVANYLELTCQTCGKTGQYDAGLLSFNIRKFNDKAAVDFFEQDSLKLNILEYSQFTGYFRCYYCNDAGKWLLTPETDEAIKKEFLYAFITLKENSNLKQKNPIVFNEIAYDGGRIKPRWATDAEQHFLDILEKKPKDSYRWNRLGNLYFKGRRFDLAFAAFEKSLEVDPKQVESLFSLGKIFFWVGDDEKAKHFFRQVILYACSYRHLGKEKMKEMLAASMQALLQACSSPKEFAAILPMAEEIITSNNLRGKNIDSKMHDEIGIELDSERSESFLPLAEIYLFEQAGAQKETAAKKGPQKKSKKRSKRKK